MTQRFGPGFSAVCTRRIRPAFLRAMTACGGHTHAIPSFHPQKFPAMMAFQHIPVLLDDVLKLLSPQPGEHYLDVTLGGAGHAGAVANKIQPHGEIVGFDRDPAAQAAASAKLQPFGLKTTLFQHSFIAFDSILRNAGMPDREQGGGFDIVLADFGLSSHQIDDAERGFSFHSTAPLDMRMSQTGETAAEFLANIAPEQLADILYQYSDIRQSRQLARRICERAQTGTLQTTTDLAELCCGILGHPRPGQPHPATRVFQAIRIAVNDEFGAIDAFLKDIPKWMKPNGRLAIISFHSGEDRRVKEAMKQWQNPCTCPPKLPMCICQKQPLGKVINKKVIEATPQELAENSRARSAKLRGFLFN